MTTVRSSPSAHGSVVAATTGEAGPRVTYCWSWNGVGNVGMYMIGAHLQRVP
ncbi:MAG: hypothetical protein WB984_02915 [Thermoplasmata archaeon]